MLVLMLLWVVGAEGEEGDLAVIGRPLMGEGGLVVVVVVPRVVVSSVGCQDIIQTRVLNQNAKRKINICLNIIFYLFFYVLLS